MFCYRTSLIKVRNGKYNLEKVIEVVKNNVLEHSNNYLLKFRIGFLFFAYSWKAMINKKIKIW